MSLRPLVPCVLTAVLALSGCATVEAGRHLDAGNAALDAGRPAEAIPHFEAAIALVPEASELHNHLGIALAAEGRHRQALASFERAVFLDCDNQAAQQNLANARAVAERGFLDGSETIP